nr:biotin-dependent carboxyltransferase family protein [Geomicrobium sp. JCM 19037]
MNIEVVKPGMLTTVQDAGRYGYLDQGVVQSGAMDRLALRTANLLVGNDEQDAALELTVTGPVLRFHQPALIAVTGGGMTPHVDGQAFSIGVPIYLPEESILTFRAERTGIRAYVAIAGGFNVPEVLNSQSTYLRAGFGGYEGRALKEGDLLDSNPLSQEAKQYMESVEGEAPFAPKWGANLLWLDDEETDVLRVFPGLITPGLRQKASTGLPSSRSYCPRSPTGWDFFSKEMNLCKWGKPNRSYQRRSHLGPCKSRQMGILEFSWPTSKRQVGTRKLPKLPSLTITNSHNCAHRNMYIFR